MDADDDGERYLRPLTRLQLDVTVDTTLNKLNARLPLVAITELLYFLGVKKWYACRRVVF
jgi:hypothetical protein